MPFRLPIYEMWQGLHWRLSPAPRRNPSEAERQSSPYSRWRQQCQTSARAAATLLSLAFASKLVFVPIPASKYVVNSYHAIQLKIYRFKDYVSIMIPRLVLPPPQEGYKWPSWFRRPAVWGVCSYGSLILSAAASLEPRGQTVWASWAVRATPLPLWSCSVDFLHTSTAWHSLSPPPISPHVSWLLRLLILHVS